MSQKLPLHPRVGSFVKEWTKDGRDANHGTCRGCAVIVPPPSAGFQLLFAVSVLLGRILSLIVRKQMERDADFSPRCRCFRTVVSRKLQKCPQNADYVKRP